MNIFKGLFFKVCQSIPFQTRSLQFAALQCYYKKERSNKVITHRKELLPFTINNLWDNPGTKILRKKVGRGIGSGKGRTATRGQKGQKCRPSVKVQPSFEGGQTPMYRRIPKMGITRLNRERPVIVNMKKILYYIYLGRLDPKKTITMKDMHRAGVFHTAKYGVKILSSGYNEVKFPLHLEVTDASANAIKAIKEQGGSVTCVYKTPLLMKETIHPEKFPFKLNDPVPTARKARHMEKIRSRGANVVYNIPNWVKEDIEKQKKEEQEDKKAKQEFDIPVSREPGCGRSKIRKRKPLLFRTIDYKL